MKEKYALKLDAIEEEIRKANWQVAAERLLALKNRKVPEAFLKRYAILARRANVPQYALSLLKPIVRGTNRKGVISSEDLRAEYAANLVRLGVCQEAQAIYNSIDYKKVPEAHQTAAHLHIKNWDYAQAITHLEAFLNISSLTKYTEAIAKINLSLCHIYEENYQVAANYLNDVLTLEANEQTHLLKGNALRFLGNMEYQQENYATALQFFKKARLQLSSSTGIDAFLIEKWIALSTLHLEAGSERSRQTVKEISEKALKIRHWESLRDIDYQLGMFDKNESLLLRVYFGTPFSSFRERILRKLPSLSVPSEYTWNLGKADALTPRTRFDINEQEIKAGQLIHRVLSALSKDFYRPLTSIDIFDKAFQDSAYSSKHSEQRVYQAMMRVRQWLEDKKLPLLVDSTDNYYSLGSSVALDFIVRIEEKPMTQSEFRIKKLQETLPHPFTLAEAATVLGISARRTSDLLHENVKAGVLEITGKASKTRYIFKSSIEYKLTG